MATLESRIAELFTLLDGNVEGVNDYEDFEPPAGHLNGPVALTVSWVETTPDYWRIRIRIYAQATTDVKKAAERIRQIPIAVDALLTSPFGPSSWSSGLTDDQDAYVAESILDVGREDY